MEKEGEIRVEMNISQTHTHTHTVSQTSASGHLSSFILPDWLVVKLMLVYRAGKGLRADTSFMACTCQCEKHTAVTFEAFHLLTLMTSCCVGQTKPELLRHKPVNTQLGNVNFLNMK